MDIAKTAYFYTARYFFKEFKKCQFLYVEDFLTTINCQLSSLLTCEMCGKHPTLMLPLV